LIVFMTRLQANTCLLLTALIWGTTFVPQQLGMDHVGALTFTSARFLLGALLVLPLAWFERRQLRSQAEPVPSAVALYGAILGALLFVAATLQQVGIGRTTVSNAGFLTAMYVPLVPLLIWIMQRKRPPLSLWLLVAGCLLSIGLLTGARWDAWREGDYWVLASTIFWAAHVVGLGQWAQKYPAPLQLAAVQFLVCALLSGVFASTIETPQLASLALALPAIAYAGILSVGLAFTLQVFAQRHTSASTAAILLSSEVLFAALAAYLWLGERLTFQQWCGGLLMFVCIVLVQLKAPS
jgi:drug/metabolite transporter (DMT)-like permease